MKKPFLSKPELLKMFGGSMESLNQHYRDNAAQMRKMAEKAHATGKKVNGFSAAELEEKAKWFEEIASK